MTVLTLGLLAGTVTGFAMERGGVVDPVGEPAPVISRTDRVAVLDCPDGHTVSSLSRGDRVLAVGRSEDGDWLAIRSPVDLDRTAWVHSTLIDGDPLAGRVSSLPVQGCDAEEPTATTSTSTSTSTTSTTTTTSTSTTVAETTTTEPPPTTIPATTSTTVAETTTTGPPATTTTTTLGPP